MIRNRKPGGPVSLTVDRKGVTMTVRLVTKDVNGQPVVGVGLTPSYDFPFTVKINLPNIGGPTARLLFPPRTSAKLTPHNLTGGRALPRPRARALTRGI